MTNAATPSLDLPLLIRAQLAARESRASGEELCGLLEKIDPAISPMQFQIALVALAADGLIRTADGQPITMERSIEDLWQTPVALAELGDARKRPNTLFLAQRIVVFLDRKLGSGSHADVYLGFEWNLRIPVAVKLLRLGRLPEWVKADDVAERFKRESPLLAALNLRNPNHILQVFAAGEDQGEIYSAMRLAEGGTLEDRLASEGALSPETLLVLMTVIAGALHTAASALDHPIYHRDVKPANILITAAGPDGYALGDFGFAREVRESRQHPYGKSSQHTKTDRIFGTPGFVALELWTGEKADERSDMYSLAATIYYAATLRMVYDVPEDSLADWYFASLNQKMRPIREFRPDFPPAFEKVILKCLEKNPRDRYQSYPELLADLRKLARPGTPESVTRTVSLPSPLLETTRLGLPANPALTGVIHRIDFELLALAGDAEARLGPGALSTNPDCMRAVAEMARGRGLFPLLASIHERANGLPAPLPDFEDRYFRELADLAEGRACDPATALPLEIAAYAHLAIRNAQDDRAAGRPPSIDPAEKVLAFLTDAIEDPLLAVFRADRPAEDARAGAAAEATEVVHPAPSAPTPPPPPREEEDDPYIGKKPLGRLEIRKVLGKGGMGRVYLAYDPKLTREVAVKVLRSDLADDAEIVERLKREARAAAQFSDPNIVQVYDIGEEGSVVYITLEYVAGKTLADLLQESAEIPTDEALTIARDAAKGLEAAHGRKLIHRDIKPQNILLAPARSPGGPRWTLKIADFGLVRSSAPDAETMNTLGFQGTLAYASPEQFTRREELDHRTDLYSLGVVLYEMLSGRRPFEEPDYQALMLKIANPDAPPAPLADRAPGLAPEILTLVERAITKDPAKRFQSAREFIDAIEAILAGRPALPPKEEDLAAPARPKPRRFAAAVSVLVLAAIAMTLLVAKPWDRGIRTPLGKGDLARAPETGAGDADRKDGTKNDGKGDARKTNPPGGGNGTKTEGVPRPNDERPIAAMTERLLNSVPTEAETTFVRSLLAIAAEERAALAARQYDSFRSKVDALVAQERVDLRADDSYRAWHARAAREIADLAQEAVRARVRALSDRGKRVEVRRRDGTTLAGDVVDADKNAVTIAGPGGSTPISFDELAPADFLEADVPAASKLAYQILSSGPTGALRELLRLLESVPDAATWVPFAVRLARLEATAAAGVGDYARSRSLFADLVGSATLRSDECAPLKLFAWLAPEFAAARKEEGALALLIAGRHADVAIEAPDTLAYAPAARALFEEFGRTLLGEADLARKLAAKERDRAIEKALQEDFTRYNDLASAGFHLRPLEDIPEKKRPRPEDLPKVLDLLEGGSYVWELASGNPDDRDHGIGAETGIDILKGKASIRRFDPVLGVRRGFVLTYAFQAKAPDSYWVVGLANGAGDSRSLRISSDALGLYDGAGGLLAQGRSIQPPKDGRAWRSITVVPVATETGSVVLVYADGDPFPALRMPAANAVFPDRPIIGVMNGILRLDRMVSKWVQPTR